MNANRASYEEAADCYDAIVIEETLVTAFCEPVFHQ